MNTCRLGSPFHKYQHVYSVSVARDRSTCPCVPLDEKNQGQSPFGREAVKKLCAAMKMASPSRSRLYFQACYRAPTVTGRLLPEFFPSLMAVRTGHDIYGRKMAVFMKCSTKSKFLILFFSAACPLKG